MTLLEQIGSDFKDAMKAKDELRLSTLRMARADLKNKEIEKRGPLTDEDAVSVIKTMVKRYKDALADFEKAGRGDLAEKQRAEIAILEAYLPAQMPDEEIEAVVREVMGEMEEGTADIGKVMGGVMKKIAGRADGNRVRAMVQKMGSMSTGV